MSCQENNSPVNQRPCTEVLSNYSKRRLLNKQAEAEVRSIVKKQCVSHPNSCNKEEEEAIDHQQHLERPDDDIEFEDNWPVSIYKLIN